MRHLPELTQLAPIANQVGRREALTFLSIILGRERFVRDEITDALLNNKEHVVLLEATIAELDILNYALTYGAHFGITEGKRGSAAVLDLLNNPACLLPSGNCDSGRVFNNDRVNGLSHLITTTMNAIKFVDKFSQLLNETTFPPMDRVRDTAQQPEMRFLIDNFRGDLAAGFKKLSAAESNSDAVSQMHFELRLLFGVSCGVAIFIFYIALFRQGVAFMIQEAVESRLFLTTIPTTAISKKDFRKLASSFVSQDFIDFFQQ